jgi:hypothetical protein
VPTQRRCVGLAEVLFVEAVLFPQPFRAEPIHRFRISERAAGELLSARA